VDGADLLDEIITEHEANLAERLDSLISIAPTTGLNKVRAAKENRGKPDGDNSIAQGGKL
jgi:hypothetical protein